MTLLQIEKCLIFLFIQYPGLTYFHHSRDQAYSNTNQERDGSTRVMIPSPHPSDIIFEPCGLLTNIQIKGTRIGSKRERERETERERERDRGHKPLPSDSDIVSEPCKVSRTSIKRASYVCLSKNPYNYNTISEVWWDWGGGLLYYNRCIY